MTKQADKHPKDDAARRRSRGETDGPPRSGDIDAREEPAATGTGADEDIEILEFEATDEAGVRFPKQRRAAHESPEIEVETDGFDGPVREAPSSRGGGLLHSSRPAVKGCGSQPTGSVRTANSIKIYGDGSGARGVSCGSA